MEDPAYAISLFSELEMTHFENNGNGKENVNEANEVKIDIVEHRDDSNEHHEDPPEIDGTNIYARFLVESAKDKCFIHKVHPGLRDRSTKSYEPVLLSIGPYHRGINIALQDMENHKDHYLQVLLDREKRRSSHKYIEALKNEIGELQALDCYRDTHDLGIAFGDSITFGECMVRDGLFMIEFFRRNMMPGKYAQDISNDMLFTRSWMRPLLARDMLLFENQIPFFVLRALFSLTEPTTEDGDLFSLFLGLTTERNFVQLVLEFFEFREKPIPNLNERTSLDDIPHLLGLVYQALVPETFEQQNYEWASCEFIRTAVALKEVGVRFDKSPDDAKFYDISFNNGELKIPRLVIDDNTESFFRNLVAYEQYSKYYGRHRVADYLRVMDCLINSSKDVELLRHCGIIENRIGDDEKVSTMFNHLCSGVYFDQTDFLYAKMFDDVNKFCKNPWNMRIATLKNDYFGSPWSVISFIAAGLLLLFTAFQTGYSVASYYQPRSKG